MTGPKVTFTPSPKVLAFLDRDEWFISHDFADWTSTVAGTGSTTRSVRRALTLSGTTAAGTALLRNTTNMGWSAGKVRSILNWSKKIVFHAFISNPSSTTNGVSRLTFGKLSSNGVGDLAHKGIGIQLDADALKGIVHNGSSGATVDLSTTLTAGIVYKLTIVSDGAGNVEWFLDGVSKGTSSAGPTGDGATNKHIVQIETDNGADAAQQDLEMYSLKIYVEQ